MELNLPFSSCFFFFSLGTKVPSAFATQSDFVFANCIRYTMNNHITMNNIHIFFLMILDNFISTKNDNIRNKSAQEAPVHHQKIQN